MIVANETASYLIANVPQMSTHDTESGSFSDSWCPHTRTRPYTGCRPRGIIARELARGGYSLDDLELQICGLPDLEDLCWLASATGESLAEVLIRKLSNSVDAESEITAWVRNVWPEGKGGRIPALDRAWDENFSNVMQSLRGDLPPVDFSENQGSASPIGTAH